MLADQIDLPIMKEVVTGILEMGSEGDQEGVWPWIAEAYAELLEAIRDGRVADQIACINEALKLMEKAA